MKIEYNPSKIKPYSVDFKPAYLIDNGHYLHGETTYTVESLLHLIKGYLELQKEMIENVLNDLKQRTLDEQDQETLATAEQYYSQGKEGDAIILIMKILER